jgi:diguanylate cyclase (GGDEF)-like protein
MTEGIDYYSSYPIRVGDSIVGAAVLKKPLDGLEADLRAFYHPFFLLDPDGIIVLTNRSKLLLRPMWPLSAEKQLTLPRQYGTLTSQPVLKSEILDATWSMFDGEHAYMRRRYVNHSEWSWAIVMPTSKSFAHRSLGIVITLLVTLMILIYLLGKERRLHDNVQMEKRLRLQELAQELRLQATTDPLTGLHNRLKFYQVLAYEMLRSQRYKTSLALVLYDVDDFKGINDTHGHQIGDAVLIQLSRFVSSGIRTTDLLARWGGEEFIILVPGSDGQMAYQAAEKLRVSLRDVLFEEAETVACSFGVAQYADGDTTETFIARADVALYRAKSNGRNRVELAPQPALSRC